MASAGLPEELTCAVCLALFSEPVTLACGHSFCRHCTGCLLDSHCPLCRTPVPTDARSLPTSHALKSLAEMTKEAERMKEEHGPERQKAELCPEHEEKLKLFCVTDQQLACIICRDGEKHDGHKFKPIKEAAASLRQELEKGVESLSADILSTECLANTQREEIGKTKEKSQQLMTQICRQFEEMHQFLRKREDEIKNELKCKEADAVEVMTKALIVIEAALSERRELQGKVTSVLNMEDSERFLMSWTEGNSTVTSEDLHRPRVNDLRVENCTLFLGPHESHLQFFLWKEMLEVVQPRAELLSLRRDNSKITVSDDGRSLFCTPKSIQAQSASSGLHPAFGHSQKSLSFASASAFDQSQKSLSFASASAFGHSQKSLSFASASAFGQSQKSSPFASASAFGQSQKSSPFASASAFGQSQKSSPFASASAFGQSQNSSPSGIVLVASQTVFSVNTFTSGQHYWEVEVGCRDYWELGITNHFLKCDGQKYAISSPNGITELALAGSPRKIGIYVDLSSKRLSFYNADNMTHIHSMSSVAMPTSLSAYFTIRSRDPDPNPLTVCWY